MKSKPVTKSDVPIKKKGFMYYLKRDWELYVLLAVPLALVLVFKFLPMAGLSIAFLDYKPIRGFAGSEFIGFEVFKKIFTSKDFYTALKNTLLLNILDLLIGFPAPIILAVFLNEIRCKWFKRTTQTVLYLPHFLSWVIIAGLAYQLFSPLSGYVNVFIARLGGSSIPFLTEKWHWLVSYVLIGVWQSMGWGTIIYLAAITGIDAELYEAAMEVVDLFPRIGYDEWADKLLVMYPAEVIDALGVDEEEVEKGLREIWGKMEMEGV